LRAAGKDPHNGRVSPERLQASLHERIPLTRALGVVVRRAESGGVVVEAPLEPNVNHSGTVFGGSASAVAVLAAWALVEVRLEEAGQPARIVIRRSGMDFERPITGAFRATAQAPEPQEWSRLLQALQRGRMGRIAVRTVLTCGVERVGELEGEFAVIPP
jgi:thioesterase domain-containing protein